MRSTKQYIDRQRVKHSQPSIHLTEKPAIPGLTAIFVATTVCRRLGISQDSRQVEIIRRGAETSRDDSATDIELRWPTSIWLGLACFVGFFSLLILVLVLTISAVPGTEIYGFYLAAGLGAAALGLWLAYFYQFGFIGSADEEGIKGYHKSSLKVRSVKWDEIESCEVTVVHDVMGRLSHPRFVFKDDNGKVLIDMTTIGTTSEQTGQFKKAVEYHLSKA
jgi:uncharacterized protein YdeI (BOF family)